MGEVFKATKQQKEEARKRLNSKERKRGNDLDYANELVKAYEKFTDTREKVNKIGE